MIEKRKSTIIENYKQLIGTATMQKFMEAKGELCLATESISTEVIVALHQHGHMYFAEKYVKELQEKYNTLQHLPGIRFNYFGSIQTNKLKRTLSHCDVVEGVSNERHALKILNYLLGSTQKPRLYVQVNTGKEPQKRGVFPEMAAALIGFCKEIQLPIHGLMCIPPRFKYAEDDYRFLRKLADQFQLEHCQMGFSHDYQLAINCGATAIRIGTLVFGDCK